MTEQKELKYPTKGQRRRQDILEFIQDYRGFKGYYPSVGEIAYGLNTMKSNIHHHLLLMEKEGTLTHAPGIARSWRLTSAE